MGYQSAVATYHRMREQHKNDPEAQAMIAQFGLEIATERVADVLHTSAIAYIVIDGIRQKSANPPTS